MEKDIIASVQADAFTQELLQFIINTGVGTYSKTDIYDYIVYLANKHSSNSFFDINSNFDNAVLFKVSETKIKNMRQNIALKFKGEERTNVYYDFFSKLKSESIKVQIPSNSDEYILFIGTLGFLKVDFRVSKSESCAFACGINCVSVFICVPCALLLPIVILFVFATHSFSETAVFFASATFANAFSRDFFQILSNQAFLMFYYITEFRRRNT